jgi:hypothetical protein
MTADDALLWTDRARLRDVPYRRGMQASGFLPLLPA